MATRVRRFAIISSGITLLAVVLVPLSAEAVPVSRVKDGVTYTADSSNVGAGATVSAYDNQPEHKNVVIPEQIVISGQKYTVKNIGDYAFSSPGNELRKISFPDSLRTIGDYSFSNTKIKKVVIPDSVRTIGELAFNNCAQLTEVILGKRVEVIETYAFAGIAVAHVVIPASVTSIGDNAFYINGLMKSVRFKGAAPMIGTNVFSFAHPSIQVRYESRFDDTVDPGGFSLGTWASAPSFLFPKVTVRAPSRVKDNGTVTIKVLVRAGTRKVHAGQVKVSFAGKTKTFGIKAPYSERKFSVPNVSGSGKTYTAKAVYQGHSGDHLLKNKGTKKIKVVE